MRAVVRPPRLRSFSQTSVRVDLGARYIHAAVGGSGDAPGLGVDIAQVIKKAADERATIMAKGAIEGDARVLDEH
jgi:hypothetical protein